MRRSSIAPRTAACTLSGAIAKSWVLRPTEYENPVAAMAGAATGVTVEQPESAVPAQHAAAMTAIRRIVGLVRAWGRRGAGGSIRLLCGGQVIATGQTRQD